MKRFLRIGTVAMAAVVGLTACGPGTTTSASPVTLTYFTFSGS